MISVVSVLIADIETGINSPLITTLKSTRRTVGVTRKQPSSRTKRGAPRRLISREFYQSKTRQNRGRHLHVRSISTIIRNRVSHTDLSNTMATQQFSQPTTPEAYLDLGITLAINNWPALTLAVQSLWGGPTSSDKRDWLCGAISEMLSERPETDAEDLEDVLVQVMNDEFDVVVEDESATPVAALIMEIKKGVDNGEFGAVQELLEAWQKKSQQKANNVAAFKKVETNDDDQETDDEVDGDDDGVQRGNGDVDMGEAPSLVRAPKEKVQPEVDEDGFTKVVGKKR